MKEIIDLEKRISSIEKRNKKVELDKKWETSLFRKISIALITYIFMSLFFISINLLKNIWIKFQ